MMKSIRNLKTRHVAAGAAAAALAVAAIAQPALAQDSWTQQVRGLLQEGAKTFQDRGYSMTHSIYTGSLNGSSRENVTLDLEIGTEYQIMGACDTDCSDVDLVLRGPNGGEIDSDLLGDDFPIVSVTPTRSGKFTLNVIMVSCSAAPCRYGIGVFGK